MDQVAVNDLMDARMAALCIDSLILMRQCSFTADYFKERMKIFIDPMH